MTNSYLCLKSLTHSSIAPRRKGYLNVSFHKHFLHRWYCVIIGTVQVVARGARGPLGGGCGVLREPGKAETHIASLRGPGPLAGGDDLCLLRAGHGSVKRGHKREQGEQEREGERG